jgi:hypothetical protein
LALIPAFALVALIASATALDAQRSARGPAWPSPGFTIDQVEIQLQSQGCTGECPVYTVHVSGTGGIGYVGTEHVAVTEPQRRIVGERDVVELLDEFYEARFFEYQPEYTFQHLPLRIRDNGSVGSGLLTLSRRDVNVITIRLGDFEKRVMGRRGSFAPFDRLVERIGEFAKVTDWTEATSGSR